MAGVDEAMGARKELKKGRPASFCLEIGDHRTLARIERLVLEPILHSRCIVDKRSQLPQPPTIRRLNANYLGAEVREKPAREDTGLVAHLDDPEA